MSRTDFLEEALRRIESEGRLRAVRAVEPIEGMRVRVEGREAVNFCSNDYLGMATDERVRHAAAEAAAERGAGSGAARLITGTRELHLELERRLARAVGAESALLFGAGYLAGVGVIDALAGKGDAVFSDALNHACLIDGCRLSGAEVVVYPHADARALARLLEKSTARRKLVVTESVFSMDGDVAPLTGIADACRRFGALLAVDEAHALGVVGERGEGVVASLGLTDSVDALIATLGKALGSFGAFVAGSETMIRYLTNRARTFVFQTALPPAAIGAALESVRILKESPALVHRLQANIRRLREGLAAEPDGIEPPAQSVPSVDTAIIPLLLGAEETAMRTSAMLLEHGVLVQGIRPPTVPPGTSRLRVTVSAAHTDEQIDHAVRAIHTVIREVRP